MQVLLAPLAALLCSAAALSGQLRPPAPVPLGASSIVVVPPAAPVPVNGIAEWTLNVTEGTCSPGNGQPRSSWEALDVVLDLVPPVGAPPYNSVHRGFLYAGSTWKVRAALQIPGQYMYSMVATCANSSTELHRSQGTAVCSTSAAAQSRSVGPHGFLRPRFGLPPFRTAYDDGILFTGLGLGDCLNDKLTFHTYNESSGGRFTRSLEQYAADYGEAGFNIFRWSNGNCAWLIEERFDGALGRPNGNAYNETLVLELDRLYDTFRAHGMSMWAVPFSYVLFPTMGDGDTAYYLAQRRAVEKHLEFVVARWGAQTDVWSLLNEQHADARWLAIAANHLRTIDPYRHPITSSWNDHLNMSQIEIDSVHWYTSPPALPSARSRWLAWRLLPR